MRKMVAKSVLVLFVACAFVRAVETPVVDAAKTRAAFLKIIDRPRMPLAAEASSMPDEGAFKKEHFTFATEADMRVPGILLKPAGEGRHPAVICMHGTSSKKESNLALMKELAGKGIIGVAIDGRFHGERCKAGSGDVEYNEAIARAYKEGKGHPWLYDTVWDAMRLIDYLQTRPDIDATRIGVMGFSKGGMETYLTSAMDERVTVSIPCIGMQSFAWGLEHDGWRSRIGTVYKGAAAAAKEEGSQIDREFTRKFFDKLLPGIYTDFDGPAIVQLICPRPLMVINGDLDDKTPLEGVKICGEAAVKAYGKDNADKFKLIIQENTKHAVTPAARKEAVEWFVKWLKP